jgi:hypothetical protein
MRRLRVAAGTRPARRRCRPGHSWLDPGRCRSRAGPPPPLLRRSCKFRDGRGARRRGTGPRTRCCNGRRPCKIPTRTLRSSGTDRGTADAVETTTPAQTIAVALARCLALIRQGIAAVRRANDRRPGLADTLAVADGRSGDGAVGADTRRTLTSQRVESTRSGAVADPIEPAGGGGVGRSHGIALAGRQRPSQGCHPQNSASPPRLRQSKLRHQNARAGARGKGPALVRSRAAGRPRRERCSPR